MPNVLLTESIAVELGAVEPWPDDATLYQPTEGQLLLPDEASCLSVQAYLRMCAVPFLIQERANAEEMSPSGKVPFVRCGKFVIAEMDKIVGLLSNKRIHLTSHLDPSQNADMRAYMSLINTILYNAELYMTWYDKETYNNVTKHRYGSVHPWPLNVFLCWKKFYNVISHLSCLEWLDKSREQVYLDIDNCCSALSERLEMQDYFFGDKPTELDALVFGHVSSLLKRVPEDNGLSEIFERYKNLVQLCKRIAEKYFL